MAVTRLARTLRETAELRPGLRPATKTHRRVAALLRLSTKPLLSHFVAARPPGRSVPRGEVELVVVRHLDDDGIN